MSSSKSKLHWKYNTCWILPAPSRISPRPLPEGFRKRYVSFYDLFTKSRFWARSGQDPPGPSQKPSQTLQDPPGTSLRLSKTSQDSPRIPPSLSMTLQDPPGTLPDALGSWYAECVLCSSLNLSASDQRCSLQSGVLLPIGAFLKHVMTIRDFCWDTFSNRVPCNFR